MFYFNNFLAYSNTRSAEKGKFVDLQCCGEKQVGKSCNGVKWFTPESKEIRLFQILKFKTILVVYACTKKYP